MLTITKEIYDPDKPFTNKIASEICTKYGIEMLDAVLTLRRSDCDQMSKMQNRNGRWKMS